MKRLLILATLAAATLGLGYAYTQNRRVAAQPINYRTELVRLGDLEFTVGATGTVEPEEVVDVGAQVMGRIREIGPDPQANSDSAATRTIDYGSTVEEGMLLAQIDSAVYVAQRDQAQANLDRAKAELQQLQAKLVQSEADWSRAKKLHNTNYGGSNNTSAVLISSISDADYDLAKANYETAKASIEVGKSAIAQSTSALSLAETNLSYTTIKSPVSGTIIDRRVNIGQTVVANLNAPSLFLIAKDLRRMQVWASVNEADIGLLKVDMPVHFGVDAFPDDTFYGNVTQIRLNASMTQNVVTYTVVITTDNSNLKLLPYLTADVKFEVEKRIDVLYVPNSALRYIPPIDRLADANPESAPKPKSNKEGLLWTRVGDRLRPVLVDVGITDGTFTEVSGDGVSEGLEVVLGERTREETQEVNNPFAPPKIPKNKQKQDMEGGQQ